MEVQIFSEMNIAISSTAIIRLERVTTYIVQKGTLHVIVRLTAYLLALSWYYPKRPEEEHKNSDQVGIR
jgi:CRP-like cAMP-binding protein